MGDGNEVDVEAVDSTTSEWMEETAEIRLRGKRRYLMGLMGSMNVGNHTLRRMDGEAETAIALISENVVQLLQSEGFDEETVLGNLDGDNGVWINTQEAEEAIDVTVLDSTEIGEDDD